MAGNTLTAYRIPGKEIYPAVVPAAADRDWMDFGTRGWANRCLPLRIANANGWFVLNPHTVEMEWNGDRGLDALRIHTAGRPENLARSMFGYGIVTWVIPYLFHTTAGFNLQVRGPANQPKDGAAPLEGIVEADWLPFPFTMNWQITRPGKRIRFEKDEPIAMIVPLRRAETESFAPEIRNLESDENLLARYQKWNANRQEAAKQVAAANNEASAAVKKSQGHYIRGEYQDGERITEHQAKLAVNPFVEVEPATIVPRPVAVPPATKPSLLERLTGMWGGR